jgi:hypothetical protein
MNQTTGARPPTGYRPESCAHDDGFAEEAAIDPSDGRRDSAERPRSERSQAHALGSSATGD